MCNYFCTIIIGISDSKKKGSKTTSNKSANKKTKNTAGAIKPSKSSYRPTYIQNTLKTWDGINVTHPDLQAMYKLREKQIKEDNRRLYKQN